MIFKESVFKRLAREAYKDEGLRMAWLNDNSLVIGGRWWIIEIADEALTKKMKAAIIELTGDIPSKGAYLYKEKVPTVAFDTNELEKILASTYTEYIETAKDSGLMRAEDGYLKRALIATDEKVYAVFASTMDLIDTSKLMPTESMPQLPTIAHHDEKAYMTIQNNYCRLTVTCQMISDEFVAAVRGIKL